METMLILAIFLILSESLEISSSKTLKKRRELPQLAKWK